MSARLDRSMRKLAGLEIADRQKYQIEAHKAHKELRGGKEITVADIYTLHTVGTRNVYQMLKRGMSVHMNISFGPATNGERVEKHFKVSRKDVVPCPQTTDNVRPLMFVIVCLTDCEKRGQCLPLLKKLGSLEEPKRN